MGLMQITNLSVEHRLSDVSMSLKKGEMLGLIGPNGAGKSTLLAAISGLVDYQGRIEFSGEDLAFMDTTQRARSIALQPQFAQSAWALSVHDVVSMGRLPWGDSDQEIIQQAMQQAGVLELARRPVGELSGGEKARVWLARVLANQPRVLLADEPVANLDMAHQQQAMQGLQQYTRAGNTVVVAIHDLALAAQYCDRLCLLDQGQCLLTDGIEQVLTRSRLEAVFKTSLHIDLKATPPQVQAYAGTQAAIKR